MYLETGKYCCHNADARTCTVHYIWSLTCPWFTHTHQFVVEDTFTLGREKCPPGNKLKPDSSTLYYTCDCNVENEDIIDCERRTLILKVWPRTG